ncbi:hypothetical protein TSUD_249270 [Trifolium subterraneum]|nr:hypothetical protein TSUD_249270 [Trifolium subterraneum]
MANCIRMSFLLRVIGRMFGDIEKENKAFVAEITELKKLTTSLKDERNKLKKTLEKSHKVTVDKLKAEIEELKGEISLQYKAGYDNAGKKLVVECRWRFLEGFMSAVVSNSPAGGLLLMLLVWRARALSYCSYVTVAVVTSRFSHFVSAVVS